MGGSQQHQQGGAPLRGVPTSLSSRGRGTSGPQHVQQASPHASQPPSSAASTIRVAHRSEASAASTIRAAHRHSRYDRGSVSNFYHRSNCRWPELSIQSYVNGSIWIYSFQPHSCGGRTCNPAHARVRGSRPRTARAPCMLHTREHASATLASMHAHRCSTRTVPVRINDIRDLLAPVPPLPPRRSWTHRLCSAAEIALPQSTSVCYGYVQYGTSSVCAVVPLSGACTDQRCSPAFRAGAASLHLLLRLLLLLLLLLHCPSERLCHVLDGHN
eukprot:COSAG02_NODE_8304_length_2623_cov_56.959984_3_plen_272_part_00